MQDEKPGEKLARLIAESANDWGGNRIPPDSCNLLTPVGDIGERQPGRGAVASPNTAHDNGATVIARQPVNAPCENGRKRSPEFPKADISALLEADAC